MRILVVDDEKAIADLIEVILKDEGYEVSKLYDPRQVPECLENEQVDLALLDIMMPGLNGFDLCRQIRQKHTFPIIMLTAKLEDMDKITGLACGADDYMTKPFNPLELIARVKAQLRRSTRYNPAIQRIANSACYDYNGLHIELQTHTCTVLDEPIPLTPTEFKILWLLCKNAGAVVSSEQIFETVWGEDYLDSNNTVMVHIRRIREKLGESPKNARFIKTVWGVGYKVEKPDH